MASEEKYGVLFHADPSIPGHQVQKGYGYDVVTPLAGDLVSDNRTVWQEVLMNKKSRSAGVYVVKNESTKHSKLSM